MTENTAQVKGSYAALVATASTKEIKKGDLKQVPSFIHDWCPDRHLNVLCMAYKYLSVKYKLNFYTYFYTFFVPLTLITALGIIAKGGAFYTNKFQFANELHQIIYCLMLLIIVFFYP